MGCDQCEEHCVCGPGEEYAPGQFFCRDCPAGMISDGTGCVLCPTGRVAWEPKQSVCTSCVPGTFSAGCTLGPYSEQDKKRSLLAHRIPERTPRLLGDCDSVGCDDPSCDDYEQCIGLQCGTFHTCTHTPLHKFVVVCNCLSVTRMLRCLDECDEACDEGKCSDEVSSSTYDPWNWGDAITASISDEVGLVPWGDYEVGCNGGCDDGCDNGCDGQMKWWVRHFHSQNCNA